MSRRSARTLALALVIVGLALVAVGLIYFTTAADKLPAFLGQVTHATAHRTKRGAAALILGLASLGAGAWLALSQGMRRHANA